MNILKLFLDERFGDNKEKEQALNFLLSAYQKEGAIKPNTSTIDFDALHKAYIERRLDTKQMLDLIVNKK
jgi:hypothetical protein